MSKVAPVFVLTHHAREPLEMKGGTTFNTVTDGIEAALAKAREAAGDRDVAIAGGAATVNQYVAAGLIDELRLHIAPAILGRGERLFESVGDIELRPVGDPWGTGLVTHVTYQVVR
ncbi:dihydrofolate reductase family protein [Spongiactinospora gelatinilytica]|nr:dihydrofolate reductase family protein [Spongiactinospora gelatinilytica]